MPRNRLVVLIASVWIELLLSAPLYSNAAQQINCPGALLTRLKVGIEAEIVPSPSGQAPTPTRVRANAGTKYAIVTQLNDGDAFTIIGGPICANSYLWWQIKAASGVTGWVAEGDRKNYFIEPVPVDTTPFVTPTPALPIPPSSRPNLVVVTHPGTQQNKTNIVAYAPGSTKPAVINGRVNAITINAYARTEFSNDGSVYAYSTTTNTGRATLFYESPGGGGVSGKVALPANVDLANFLFSADAKYLAYTTTNGQTMDWGVAIVELSSGKQRQFTGKFTYGANTRPGTAEVAVLIGWSGDNRQLILESYAPYSDGGFYGNVYAIDIGEPNFSQSAPQPFPRTRLLIPERSYLGVQLSPDATKLAYLSIDQSNPPRDYVSPQGPGGNEALGNTLSIVDVGSGAKRTIAAAPSGQAIGAFTWAQDSLRMLYTVGSFQQTYYIVLPNIYTVDVNTQQIIPGPTLSEDKSVTIDLRACSDALFFRTYAQASDGTSIVKLYSAPLTNLSARSEVLASGQDAQMSGCISG